MIFIEKIRYSLKFLDVFKINVPMYHVRKNNGIFFVYLLYLLPLLTIKTERYHAGNHIRRQGI